MIHNHMPFFGPGFGHGVHWYTVHSREKVMAKQWGNARACFLFAKLHGNEVEVTI